MGQEPFGSWRRRVGLNQVGVKQLRFSLRNLSNRLSSMRRGELFLSLLSTLHQPSLLEETDCRPPQEIKHPVTLEANLELAASRHWGYCRRRKGQREGSIGETS